MLPSVMAEVIGGLIVLAVSSLITWAITRARWKKRVGAAPKEYADHLEELIKKGAGAQSHENVEVMARAIVSARNDVRGSLTQLHSLLDSDIDHLAEQIKEAAKGARIDKEQVSAMVKTMQVLKEKWPIKKRQIEIELRKIRAELGSPPPRE